MKFLNAIVRRILILPKWILYVLVVLIVVRILIPPVGLWAINRVLDTKMEAYRGHANDFDLSLWRGAYQLQGLEIRKRTGPENQPAFVSVKEIDLSLAWRGLLKKNITADITIDEARVQFLEDKESGKKQNGTDEPTKNWSDVLGVLVPISVETLIIKNSAVYFTNTNLKEPLPISLEKIEIEARDLRSRPSEVMSSLKARALLQQHAQAVIEGDLDVISQPARADIDFKMEKFKPQTMNKMLRAYVPLDITTGEMSIYGEVASEKNNVWGYTKIFLSDGDIIAPGQDFIGIKHFFIEIIAAFGNWLLKNKESKQVALRLPFNYMNGKLDISASDAFWSAVKNSGDAMKPGIENSVALKKAESAAAKVKVIR